MVPQCDLGTRKSFRFHPEVRKFPPGCGFQSYCCRFSIDVSLRSPLPHCICLTAEFKSHASASGWWHLNPFGPRAVRQSGKIDFTILASEVQEDAVVQGCTRQDIHAIFNKLLNIIQ